MLDDLTDAQKFALTALLEVQPAATVGDFVSETDEGDFVTSYRFATTLTGYPGWNWTITVADLPDEHPTVVESELLPAEGALLAPDWIPWSERMDDYRAAQIALGEAESEVAGMDDDEDDDDDDSDDEDDEDDDDLLGSDNLHGGDLDGVDIDELADDEGAEVDDFDDELTAEAEEVIDVEAIENEEPEPEPEPEPAPEPEPEPAAAPRGARRNRRASSN